MRKGLIVLLSLGVVVGFGSGFARLAHRGSCHERYSRYERDPAPAVPPVYIVIPAAAAQVPVVVNGVPAPLAAPVVLAQPTPPVRLEQ